MEKSEDKAEEYLYNDLTEERLEAIIGGLNAPRKMNLDHLYSHPEFDKAMKAYVKSQNVKTEEPVPWYEKFALTINKCNRCGFDLTGLGLVPQINHYSECRPFEERAEDLTKAMKKLGKSDEEIKEMINLLPNKKQ